MHAFMAAILLWMSGLDAFNPNAKPQPPNREFAQVEQRLRRSKRNAVIAADVGGQATLLKKPLKHSKSVFLFGGGQRFAGQQITAGVIGDRQRITILAITQQEFPFVISAPQFIGLLTQR